MSKLLRVSALLALRIICIVGIVAAVMWIFAGTLYPVPWDRVGALVAAVVVYIGTYTADYAGWTSAGNHAGHPNDVQLFKDLLDLLKPMEVRTTFGEFDFGAPFQYKDIRPLTTFVETWNTPDKEFRDKTLETAKSETYAKARHLTGEIALRSRPMSIGFGTVKLAGYDVQPDSVRVDAKVINEAARQFAKRYAEFTRLGRSRLTVA